MGHDGHIAVPNYYGVESVSGTDTTFHTISDKKFVSHLNDTVDLKTSFPGKVLVLNFFSTEGGENNEKLTFHMQRIQDAFRQKKTDTALQIISFSRNLSDDVAALRAFSNEHTLDQDSWSFLSGSNTEMLEHAEKEFFLQESKVSKSGWFNQIVLIDKYRNIRGYYNGLDELAIKQCMDDIGLLMVEKNILHERKR